MLNARRNQAGVMMIEALVAILIFSIGILAVVGMQATAIKSVSQSKSRTEASFLAGRLLSQIWTDAGNVSSYAYTGSGTPPARLCKTFASGACTDGWMAQVNSRLPSSTSVQPIVTVTNPTGTGATVTIVLRWQLPEEKSLGLPPNNYTVVAAVYRD